VFNHPYSFVGRVPATFPPGRSKPSRSEAKIPSGAEPCLPAGRQAGTPRGLQSDPAECAVSRVLFRRPGGSTRAAAKAIYLNPSLQAGFPDESGSGLPATLALGHARNAANFLLPAASHCRCLALHPVGFTVPATSRPPRCALTAPFHPYPSIPI